MTGMLVILTESVSTRSKWVDVVSGGIPCRKTPEDWKEQPPNGVGLRDRPGVPGEAGLGATSSSARRVERRSTWSSREASCSLRRRTTDLRADHRPAEAASPRGGPVGDAPGARPRRPGARPAQAVPAERDPRPLQLGAGHLRLPGTGHRQRGDHREVRHAGAEGEVPHAAAERRGLLLLLDDRAGGRLRPHPVQDPGRA